jgi:hypothetical protein
VIWVRVVKRSIETKFISTTLVTPPNAKYLLLRLIRESPSFVYNITVGVWDPMVTHVIFDIPYQESG